MKKHLENLGNARGVKVLEKLKNDYRFDLNHEYGFSVNGKIVSEFGYLLRYLTQRKVDTFVEIGRTTCTVLCRQSPVDG